jgi:hypothetical protein
MSFIIKTIKNFLNQGKQRKLVAEYEKASLEIKTTNQELEGVISNGLD